MLRKLHITGEHLFLTPLRGSSCPYLRRISQKTALRTTALNSRDAAKPIQMKSVGRVFSASPIPIRNGHAGLNFCESSYTVTSRLNSNVLQFVEVVWYVEFRSVFSLLNQIYQPEKYVECQDWEFHRM
jgi:hypothetical protein